MHNEYKSLLWSFSLCILYELGGLLPSVSIQCSDIDAVSQWIIYVYEKIFKSIHSVFSLSHGVLEGIQFFEVDILWLVGIKPHNMVSHFCVFNHVVVVGLVHLLPIPPSLALIFLLNSCSLVSNHPTLYPSNDADSTPFIDVLKQPPCTIQDVVFNILAEVGCPDVSSKSIREYFVVHEPGACEVVYQHFLSTTVHLKL
jgi:hypothetical protein